MPCALSVPIQVPPDFLRTGGLLEVIQLWVNLPSRLKTTQPRYTVQFTDPHHHQKEMQS